MAALSSTFTSFPIPCIKNPHCTLIFPSNSKTHVAFPLSNSKRLKFSLKAEKKDEAGEKCDEEAWQKEKKKMNEADASKFAPSCRKYGDDDNIEDLLKESGLPDVFKRFDKLLKLRGEDAGLLNLIELKDCFDEDTFLVTKVERYKSGGMFYGNLRVPVDQALYVLEERLSEAGWKKVNLFLNKVDKELELVTVLPKEHTYYSYELMKRSILSSYNIAGPLSVTTLGTIALMSGFFLKPEATFDYYLADVLPLFGGLLTILGVSEIATRVTAAEYGVKLGPSVLVPSFWTGCLGIMNNYESRLPNKKALFDIPFARTASAYITSLSLIVAAFLSEGSLNGGDNPLYLRPDFFLNSPLVSVIQLINGDDLNNRLPFEVEGVGVTMNPLALAGLLGMIMTSINLLPCGGLEGRRIFEAMFGRGESKIASYATILILLATGVASGSLLFVAWGFFNIVYQSRSGPAVKDGITPLGEGRYALGLLLTLISFLTLFPNAAGTFSSWSLIEPYFRGFV